MKQMNNNISFVRETVPRSKDEFDTVKRKRKSNKNTINEPSSDNISECRLKKGVKRSAPNDETSDYNLKESSVKMPVLMERDKKKKKCVNKSKRKTKSCNVVRRNKCKTSNSSVKEVTISRKAILTSIQLLEKVHESKKLPTAKESCRRVNIENGERIWNSATNILDHVRLSILKHDWRMLSHLLQLLLKHDKMYEPIVKEATFLTVLHSASHTNLDLKSELLRCFINVSDVENNEFDVWYCDDMKDIKQSSL